VLERWEIMESNRGFLWGASASGMIRQQKSWQRTLAKITTNLLKSGGNRSS
jgi:hypothetical protein